jgi:Ser/Thr protein kinase RdoA (MazF antagonist)
MFLAVPGSDEELLTGGNVAAAVVRVGNTVRRPTGPWTPTIHAFLRHLEMEGFDGAPRVLGVDDEGREILEYLPGVVPWGAVHREQLGSAETMSRAGDLLRRFHRAAASFVAPADAVWREPDRERAADPFVDERGTIVCHNDPTAWNLVIGERWAFIDWDFAGPRPFIWDVAYALIGLLPVARDPSGLGWREPVPFRERLQAFVSGYELLRRDRERLIDVLVARIESSYDHLRLSAQAGREPWATLWNEGHGTGWADMLAFTKEQRYDWNDSVC